MITPRNNAAQGAVGARDEAAEDLGALLPLHPQPLGVGGEALVQPQVAPRVRTHGVAEPLVGRLVHDHLLGGAAAVDRKGLGLEGSRHRVGRQHGAEALEGIGPEALREEAPQGLRPRGAGLRDQDQAVSRAQGILRALRSGSGRGGGHASYRKEEQREDRRAVHGPTIAGEQQIGKRVGRGRYGAVTGAAGSRAGVAQPPPYARRSWERAG